MSDLSERYDKCPDCGAYAVHLATISVLEFMGDQDDGLGDESVYADGIVSPDDDISVGTHVCFECEALVDIWVERPRDKVIDTREHQWTAEWPTEPGMYWFFGWPFPNPGPVDDPRMISVTVFRGRNSLVYVGGGIFMYRSEFTGLWTPANLPEPPHPWACITSGGIILGSLAVSVINSNYKRSLTVTKPEPKKKIAVLKKIENVGLPCFLVIQTSSEDAGSWVRKNLTSIGDLSIVSNHRYHLHVQSEVYDIDEVVAYIENMG